ncbi:MAG: EamA family transporter, partial [Dokdonella sp.]
MSAADVESVESPSNVAHGRVMAAIFVVLWCTGYPAGKFAVLHGAPFTILLLRFVFAALMFAALAWIARAAWPGWHALGHSAVVGLLSLAISFGGVYEGLHLGVSAGVSALFIGAMPLATALLGVAIGERMRALQWLGLVLGFAGVVLVLQGRFNGSHASAWGYVAGVVGLLGLSVGTLYQKRHLTTIDLRIGLAAQHAAAALAVLPIGAFVEHFRADGSATYVAAVAWLVVV